VIGENRVQWAIAYLTAMMFDFVVVPVDRNLTHSDILNIIHDSDSTALIFSGSLLELFRDKKDALIKIKYFINMDSGKREHDFYSMTELINNEHTTKTELPKINIDEVAELIYTSGSLGRAKGVMLSQKNLAVNLMAMRQMVTIYPEDRFMVFFQFITLINALVDFCVLYIQVLRFILPDHLKQFPEDLQKSNRLCFLELHYYTTKCITRL